MAFFGFLQIRIIGNPDIDPYPDIFGNDGVIDDIPQHNLVIGNDDNDIVGGFNFSGPQSDVDYITPGGTAGRRIPDLNSIPHLKGPIDDQ
jgi:hypothetical protein